MNSHRLELIGLGLAIVIAGCSGGDPSVADRTEAEREAAKPTATLPTPMDQGTSEVDVRITTTIRQNLVGKDGLSIEAANIQIITNGGVVVLRGTVRDSMEKAFIRNTAETTAGVMRVVDLLEYSGTK